MKDVKEYVLERADEDQLKKLAVSGMTLVSAIVVRRLIEFVWKQSTNSEPPKNPASRSVGWQEAFLFTIISGLLVSVTKLLIRRNVAVELEDEF